MAKKQKSPAEQDYKKARHRLQQRISYWKKKGYEFNRKDFIPPSSTKGMQSTTISKYIDYMKSMTKEELKYRTENAKTEYNWVVYEQEELFSHVISMFRSSISSYSDSPFIYMAEGWLDSVISTYGTKLASEKLEAYADMILEGIDVIGFASKQEKAEAGMRLLTHAVEVALGHYMSRLESEENGGYTDTYTSEEQDT